MSIVKMQKIAVIGLDEQKESIMSKLMDFGCIELVDQKNKLTDETMRKLVTVDDNQTEASKLDADVNRAEMTLRILEKYDSAKQPLFKTRRAIGKLNFIKLKEGKEQAEVNIWKVLALDEELRSTNDKINKLTQDEILLQPWVNYGLPLEFRGTSKTVLNMGVIPTGIIDVENLLNQIQSDYGAVMKIVGSDKDLEYISFLCLGSVEAKVEDLLKKNGFSKISFDGFEGTVLANLDRIKEERDALRGKVKEIEEEIALNACLRKPIEEYVDMVTVEADKEKIKSKLLKTKKTFYLEGWIPQRMVEKAEKLLDDMGCYYGFAEPEEDDTVPVLLDNKKFFVPFEAVTEMYALPDYKGFDPTTIMAIFYALFFGMMLCDVGYGAVMTIACLVVLKKYKVEGSTYKMMKLLVYCGISTIFWGGMFGGWFGDFIPVASKTIFGTEINIAPWWFAPMDDPMKLLIFSLALGVIHLFVGMGIKAYMQIKDGHWFDAVCDEGFWYFTILGLIAWLGGSSISAVLSKVGMWLAIVGVVGLILTGGRHNKGIGKVIGGFSCLSDITSYLSDILSYARILALGLASGVIAQVINTMGTIFGGGFLGIVVLLVMFVVGHSMNLAINALGAFIHSSRLQYVEFFGKFFVDGGEPFDPFRKKTKYVRIEQEEE